MGLIISIKNLMKEKKKMELYEMVSEFFGLEEAEHILNFADFLPWGVKVFASIVIFGVVVRSFMGLLISFTRGIK